MKVKESVGEALRVTHRCQNTDTSGEKNARLLPGSTLIKHAVVHTGLLVAG